MCHRWWLKGERAPGLAQQGYQWAYIFSAVRPATGEDFTLVLPVVSAAVMDLFLAQFAAALPADAHAVLVLDGAGWHDQRALTVPDNLTLVPLPAYSPELNPVERVWLYLRERFLSLRFLPDTPRPSSRLVAAPGTPSRPSRVVSAPCAPIPGLRSSLHRLAGIIRISDEDWIDSALLTLEKPKLISM